MSNANYYSETLLYIFFITMIIADCHTMRYCLFLTWLSSNKSI